MNPGFKELRCFVFEVPGAPGFAQVCCPENRFVFLDPKGKIHVPTIVFQVSLDVSFREGIFPRLFHQIISRELGDFCF